MLNIQYLIIVLLISMIPQSRTRFLDDCSIDRLLEIVDNNDYFESSTALSKLDKLKTIPAYHIPMLIKLANHQDEIIRMEVSRLMEKTMPVNDDCIKILHQLLSDESQQVQKVAGSVMMRLDEITSLDIFLKALDDNDLCETACYVLASSGHTADLKKRMDDPEVYRHAIMYLQDSESGYGRIIINGLKDPEKMEASIRALREQYSGTWKEAAKLRDVIRGGLQSSRYREVRIAADYIIQQKSGKIDVKPKVLISLLDSNNPIIRETAVWIVGCNCHSVSVSPDCLVDLFDDPSPNVRKHAAWALGRFDLRKKPRYPLGPMIVDFIPFYIIKPGQNRSVGMNPTGGPGEKNRAITGTGAFFFWVDAQSRVTMKRTYYVHSDKPGEHGAVKTHVYKLSRLLLDDDPEVRCAALWALINEPGEIDEYANAMEKVLADPDELVRIFALFLVRSSGQKGCMFADAIKPLFDDPLPDIRSRAVETYVMIHKDDRLSLIKNLLKDDDPFIRDITAYTIYHLKYRDNELIPLLAESYYGGSLWSGGVLAEFGIRGAASYMAALEMDDRDICGMAVYCLGMFNHGHSKKKVEDRITTFLKHPDPALRVAAECTLANLNGR